MCLLLKYKIYIQIFIFDIINRNINNFYKININITIN